MYDYYICYLLITRIRIFMNVSKLKYLNKLKVFAGVMIEDCIMNMCNINYKNAMNIKQYTF